MLGLAKRALIFAFNKESNLIGLLDSAIDSYYNNRVTKTVSTHKLKNGVCEDDVVVKDKQSCNNYFGPSEEELQREKDEKEKKKRANLKQLAA